ncbi:MAG: thioredoxin family protein [Rickettsiaceae bacterium H1]|nr:thioredoxin family protein [Rickettsiaceae bacterium H1]
MTYSLTENVKCELQDGINEFYSDRCPACKKQQKILDNNRNAFNEHNFYQINVNEYKELTEACDVSAFPTFITVKNGEEVDRSIGVQDAAGLHNLIDNLVV